MTSTFEQEVKQGERFRLGENWRGFLLVFNDERIAEAEKSLKQMLELEKLQGKNFVNIGFGSGLFSLAAPESGEINLYCVGVGQVMARMYYSNAIRYITGDYLKHFSDSNFESF